ncbi:hypothetical protein [Sphingomonas faeni]|uniref:hypothetical protein n=1 Tax=Sphingomonas faeni TaxID=185950 RepID=UPI0033613D20
MAEVAASSQVMDPSDARRQLEFSRMCNASGQTVFLDLAGGENLPNIVLKRAGEKPLFDSGKIVKANLVRSGDRHLTVDVAGKAEGKPAVMALTILPIENKKPMKVGFTLKRDGAAPLAFDCMPVSPPPPAGYNK